MLNRERTPKVVVIILNYNGAEDSLRCLRSIRSAQGGEYPILVVDNASVDDSVSQLRKALQRDEFLIENEANLGFAGGMNRGMLDACRMGAEFALLLNNDLVIRPGIIEELASFLEVHSDVAACGPRVNTSGIAGGSPSQESEGEGRPSQNLSLSGCAIMIRLSLVPVIGLFDETFFIYWEERDYWLRICQRGYGVYYVPTRNSVVHRVGGYMNTKPALSLYFQIRNRFLFWRRWGSSPFVPIRVMISSLYQATRHPHAIKHLFRAVADGWLLALKNPEPTYPMWVQPHDPDPLVF